MIRQGLHLLSYLPIRLWRLWTHYWRKLWVRVVVVGAMALLSLAITQVTGAMLPRDLAATVSGQAVDRLLGIIANAMLAVTTFSLTVMVTVFRSSSSQFTPRLHRLIVEDPVTQKTLAAFIGAYVYSLTGIALRELEVYADDRSFLLFVTTVLVLVYVVVSIIRWVLHLQTFGSLEMTSDQVETIVSRRLNERLSQPCLGGQRWDHDNGPPGHARPVLARGTGYVQRIEQAELNAAARAGGYDIYLSAEVGQFVLEGEVLACVADRGDPQTEGPGQDIDASVQAHVILAKLRSYDQDPRLGLIVLGEIASKALSPGINDAGTAIDIIGRQARVLIQYAQEAPDTQDIRYPRLWARPLQAEDLVQDAYGALARDGAGVIEVQIALQKTLASLSRQCDACLTAAVRAAAISYCLRARETMTHGPDLARLQAATPPEIWEQAG